MPNAPLPCGRGLARHADVPEKLSALLTALGDDVEQHAKALDLNEAAALTEYDAYMKLVLEYRRVASELVAISREMLACRDLPKARHGPEPSSSREQLQTFEAFVKRERELVAALEKDLERDQKILVEMVVGGLR